MQRMAAFYFHRSAALMTFYRHSRSAKEILTMV